MTELEQAYKRYQERYRNGATQFFGLDPMYSMSAFEQAYATVEGSVEQRIKSVIVSQVNTSQAQIDAIKKVLISHDFKGFEKLKEAYDKGQLSEAIGHYGTYGANDLINDLRTAYGDSTVDVVIDSPKEVGVTSTRTLSGIRAAEGYKLKAPQERAESLELVFEKQEAQRQVKQLEAENAKLLVENEKLRALLDATNKGSGAIDSGSTFSVSETASIAMKISEYIAKSSKVPTAEDVEKMVEMFALGRRS